MTATALAIRENVVRVTFSQGVFWSGLLEDIDGSRVEKWSVTPVAGTFGMNGEAARPLGVLSVVAHDPLATSFTEMDVTLDRPMTPWPAVYVVAWTGLWQAFYDVYRNPIDDGTADFEATYRKLSVPTLEQARPSRDIANPQTESAARTASGKVLALGTFGVDDSGDYACDEGQTNLRKRVLRRFFTRKGAFAHLRGYGIGIQDYAKTLGRASTIASLVSDAEAQIGTEPDVQAVRVRVSRRPDHPELAIVRTAIRPKTGKPFAFEFGVRVSG